MINRSTSSSTSLLALVAVALWATGCVDEESRDARASSLRVRVTSPTDLGSETMRLPDGTRTVTVAVTALDEFGAEDRGFFASVDVHAHTLGNLSNANTKIELRNGNGMATLTVPLAYGKTYLWIEDVTSTDLRPASYATGTSPILWYREPTVFDVSTPGAGQAMSTWTYRSPLEGKQVRVGTSRHGANGKLVVTGVYAQGYSVSDLDCTARPCTASPFGHVFVFSFGRPVDIRGRAVEVGHTLKWFEGGVVEFNGWTEFNFPTQEIDNATPDLTLLPVPDPFDPEWLRSTNSMGRVRLEERESSLLAVTNATVCQLDEDFEEFAQWKVNVGLGCGSALNVVTAGQVTGFDPRAYVGKPIPKIVGTLRAVNFSSFSVWILLPRSTADLVLE